MPDKDNFDDLLKRLDGLERFKLDLSTTDMTLIKRRSGGLVRFEQVKTAVGQWIDEQEGK